MASQTGPHPRTAPSPLPRYGSPNYYLPSQTWRVYVYDIEGQWINVWVPRISFVPAGIEEV